MRWRHWVALMAIVLTGAQAGSMAGRDFIASAALGRVVRADYFATHLHRLVPVPAEPWAKTTPWPPVPIGALRLWDSSTRWADLEPARGDWRFARLDAYVAEAAAHDAPILLVLGSPPVWASARPIEPGPYGPGSSAEPARMQDWEHYVRAVARRYRGRIAAYELWNEPYLSDLPADRGHPGAFYSGSVATLVDLARAARAVLSSEDPGAQLWTPGFVGSPKRLDMFLRAGGGRHVDAVAYHFYAESDERFIDLHRSVRAVLARHGLATLPIYNTESGFAAQPNGPRAAAEALARSLVLGAYLGIERYYQHAWDNGRTGMILPRTLETTPSLTAFDAVRRWLVGTTLSGCSQDSASMRCEGSRAGRRLTIAWRVPGAAVPVFSLPPGARLLALERALDATAGLDAAPLDAPIALTEEPVAVWWTAPGSDHGASR